MAKTNLKVLWKDVKSSPAILITLIVVVIFILYYVYKQNNAGSSSTANSPIYEVSTAGYDNTNPGSGSGGTTTPTGGGGGTNPPGTGIVGKIFTTIKTGSLEDSPRGKVIASIPQGGSITVLTKTTKPDPGGSSKVYYWVNYNGKHGWIGSDVFNVNG